MTPSPQVAVVMDWGGTWARVAVMDRAGESLWQSRVANPLDHSQAVFLESSYRLLKEAIGWCSDRAIAGVGIAVAGPVDAETGTLHDPPNLPALDGVSLKDRWEPLVGYPVWVGNDANLAALGEFRYGAGKDATSHGTPARTLVYVTVSTGIGGGVVNRGQVFLGAGGLSAEIGHMTIDRSASAPKCQCGNRGCLESLASGTAIARIARDGLARSGPPTSAWSAKDIESITSESVFHAAVQGDSLAKEICESVVQSLSVGLTNAVHLFNPDLLVLGGGVTVGLTELGLLPRLQSLIQQRAMSKGHQDFRLVPSRLGDGVGMAGAAAMVWNEVDSS
jgi:glucokinase